VSESALDDFVGRVRGFKRRDEIDLAAAGVMDRLGAAGVRFLLLKGPVLARLLYEPGEARGYSDIDLLIPPGDDLAVARRELDQLGYSDAGQARGIDDVGGTLHGEMWAKVGTTGPLWFDLHWRLGGCSAPAETIWAALYSGRGEIEFHRRAVPVPGRGALALHLALHAAQHGPGDVKAIGDLARGLERWDLEAWQAAGRLAEDLDGRPAFASGLRLLPAGITRAEQLGLPAFEGEEWEIANRDARPRGTFHVEALREADGITERANVVGRALIPTPEWIRWELPWAAGSRTRLIAGYAWHILRAPTWAMRAWRHRRRAGRATRAGSRRQ
jgi:hypothetical protein